MKVRSFIGYPSYKREGGDDWDAYTITMAVKGAVFPGYANVEISGRSYRITSQNTQPVIDYFAQQIVETAGRHDEGTAILVLPSSGCVQFGEDPKANRFVAAIRAAGAKVHVEAPFRWTEAMPKTAGGGGTRNSSVLQSKLRLMSLPGVRAAYLIDDVMTTGGHLRAAARCLQSHGIKPIAGICFARTLRERPDDILASVDEDLDL